VYTEFQILTPHVVS